DIGVEGQAKTASSYNGTYQVLTKTEANTLEANKPYLMVVASADDQTILSAKAPVEINGDIRTFTGKRTTDEMPIDNGALSGNYSASTPEQGDYVLTSDSHGFAKATDAINVEGLHAYIKKDAIAGATADYLVLADDDVLTGIDEIMAGDVNVDVFNLQGVQLKTNVAAPEALNELAPGVYILRAGETTVKVLK
ncbi:MAG: T9SS type A sorting domain-containing protein, partial [Muribaculaceae bacterium]|nr:T9SS type A sorting domain-containing protein [Muribaculaceae bacterium]